MGTVTVRSRTVAAVLLLAALVGAGARGLLTRASPASRPVPAARAATLHTNVYGIADGFARTRAGAVAAATSDVRQGQHLYDLSSAARAPALRAMASQDAAPAFVAEQSQQLAELDGIAARGHGRLLWLVTVAGSRVDAYSQNRALVSVWRVGVLSIDGLTAPLAEWTTVAYELVWERGDWRIWSESQTPGPTPMGHPSEPPATPEQLAAALAGFTRYPGPDSF